MSDPLAIDLEYDLDSRYERASGRIFVTGTQALVRLPLMQRERDRAAGLNTAGFISGYRGSPLGGYDRALDSAARLLKANDIVFQPGLNEDLAATAVWGSQQVGLWPGAKVDGVFGFWYGKGPGVDRSMDALKHANSAGTSKYGGVLALVGDDHGCHSSTLAHQSEQVLMAAMMPILNPASVQEFFHFGLAGIALSRFSGSWVGFKTVSETVESGASVTLDPADYDVVLPPDFDMPAGGLNIRWPDPPLDMERRLHGPRMDAVAAFARVNGLDKVVWSTPRDRFGIITTGKAYLDVRQALEQLNISPARARSLGIRLYKVGMTWPLERSGVLDFAEGLEEVFVVEEKLGFVEDQLVNILYNSARRPRVVGKRDVVGRRLVQSTGELSPIAVARLIADWLSRLGAPLDGAGLDKLVHEPTPSTAVGLSTKAAPARFPFFCSGCPHNTSTKVPEGSRAMAGIGCHGMSIWMPVPRAETVAQMGGEGATWIGQAPFSGDKHVFQNLGDGTYFHSGLMAIRAAAAAGVNITYKILFNDAVAMTGGQQHDGPLTVPAITHQVAAEGARAIVVVTDEPRKYAGGRGLASGVRVRHRSYLDVVQRELRETPGLTILIYDQTCAAEKRRRRKRNQFPDPQKRVFINAAVCEGCGDCGAKSNCVSIAPLETELGRKRQIDQSSCNKDFSCLEGFCPSFVTVRGGRLRKASSAAGSGALEAKIRPATPPDLDRPYSVLVTGIGGTGVVTIGAIVGMAAHLEGRGCTVLDFAGLAQKNGAVMSHIRLAPSPDDLLATRIDEQQADLILGCDPVVTASAEALSKIRPSHTVIVLNTHVQPTPDFVSDGGVDLEADGMVQTVRQAAGEGQLSRIDATAIAVERFGDSIAANLFLLGYAWQRRLVPLSLGSLLRAIELNAVAVEMNKAAFEWGRRVADGAITVPGSGPGAQKPDHDQIGSVDALIAHRTALLERYQDKRYAQQFKQHLSSLSEEARHRVEDPGALTEALTRNLFKLMAYKDEYEVARLYGEASFQDGLTKTFEGRYSLEFHLAPPLFSWLRAPSGEPRKITLGPWMMSVMKVLSHMKGLRGTPFDPFGDSKDRRLERQLIDEYVATMRKVVSGLTSENFATALQIAQVPSQISGFGHVKERSVQTARMHEEALLEVFFDQAGAGAPTADRGPKAMVAGETA